MKICRTKRSLISILKVLTVIFLLFFWPTFHISAEENPSNITWEKPLTLETGSAYRGPWRMNRSNFFYVDDPQVELLPDGRAIVVWVNQTEKDIFLQILDQNGQTQFDSPVNISRTPDVFSWFPTVEVSEDNQSDNFKVHVLWQEIVFSGGTHGGEAYYAVSNDGGRNFQSPVNLSRSEAGDGKGRLTEEKWDNGSLDLESGNDGSVFAVWTEYEGRLWFRRIHYPSGEISQPVTINTNHSERPARGPSIEMGPEGYLHLAWTVGNNPRADIRYQILNEHGRAFDRPSIVNPQPGHSDSPKLFVSKNGIIHLAYGYAPEGIFQDYLIKYGKKSIQSDKFENFIRISDSENFGFSSANFPSLVGSGDNIVIIWELYSGRRARSKAMGYSFSGDAGRNFSDPEIIPGSRAPDRGFNGSQQGKLMEKLSYLNGRIGLVNSQYAIGRESWIEYISGSLNHFSR